MTTNTTIGYSHGDWIVHCHYGVGQIEDVERKRVSDQENTYFHIKTADSIIWMPVEHIDNEQIRSIVVYARPDHLATTKKQADPMLALKETLNAVERQVRKKREKLREPWQQPGNDPVSTEMDEIIAADAHLQEGS